MISTRRSRLPAYSGADHARYAAAEQRDGGDGEEDQSAAAAMTAG